MRWLNLVGVALSLLTLAIAVLWVRSYWVGDVFTRSWVASEGEYDVWYNQKLQIGGGGVGYHRLVQAGTAPDYGEMVRSQFLNPAPEFHFTWGPGYPRSFSPRFTGEPAFGFQTDSYEHRNPRGGRYERQFQFIMPIWPIFLVAVAPTALWVWRVALARSRRRRSAANRCASCGYDLTGNASGRCPECGVETGTEAHATQGDHVNTGYGGRC